MVSILFQLSLVSLGLVTVHLSQVCALLFMSSILVEMYAMEVENIRLILLHRLMEEIGKHLSLFPT